jgi:hypothetical protein
MRAAVHTPYMCVLDARARAFQTRIGPGFRVRWLRARIFTNNSHIRLSPSPGRFLHPPRYDSDNAGFRSWARTESN